MAIKSFYLLGENPIKDNQSVEVDLHGNLEQLKRDVAAIFSIAEPTGIDFQTAGEAIEDLDTILDCPDTIAITIDGYGVREIPTREGLPFVGTFFETYPDHLGNHQRAFEQLGRMFKETNLGRTMRFTNDPKIAVVCFQESEYFSKKIVEDHPLYNVKDNEIALFLGDTDTENWRIAHHFMPPALSPKAVKRHVPTVQRSIEGSFPVFDLIDRDNESFNGYQYMLKMASEAVGKALMNLDFHHFDGKDAPFNPIVLNVVRLLHLNRKVSTKGNWYRYLPFGDPRTLFTLREVTNQMIKDGVAKLDKSGDDKPMLEAAVTSTSVYDYMNHAVDANGAKIPEENKAPIISIVAGAGFSTTASSLSWMMYCVANPENGNVQQRILQEMVDNGVTAETIWSYELLNELSFLDKFVKETLRLFAPNSQPTRTCLKSCILPYGYRVPKGAVVNPNSHHLAINPKSWTNPLRFDPDRWDTDEVKHRHRCSWVPFAYGPRQCIGFNFALLEVRMVVALLVYRYEILLADDTPVEMDPDFVPPRPKNLYVRMKRRYRWPSKSAQSTTNISEGSKLFSDPVVNETNTPIPVVG